MHRRDNKNENDSFDRSNAAYVTGGNNKVFINRSKNNYNTSTLTKNRHAIIHHQKNKVVYSSLSNKKSAASNEPNRTAVMGKKVNRRYKHYNTSTLVNNRILVQSVESASGFKNINKYNRTLMKLRPH